MAFVWDEMGTDIAQYLPNVDACNVLISMLQVGREDSTVSPPALRPCSYCALPSDLSSAPAAAHRGARKRCACGVPQMNLIEQIVQIGSVLLQSANGCYILSELYG